MVEQKSIIIIISDVHLGGGKSDQNDDHVYDKNQLSNFIKTIPEAKDSKVELFINGDFLEFAQVRPEVYTLNSKYFWCSEEESLQKLEAIINGHKDVFEALKEFQEKGNLVTIAPGNHDVDLFWSKVKERLREEIGKSINFESFTDYYYRFDSRLLIGHGHCFDPANKFKNWTDPICKDTFDVPRLEMCPGTLFMVKVVNWLEENGYPFADNIKPFSAFARLLWRGDRPGFKAIANLFYEFIWSYPRTVLSMEKSKEQDISKLFINKFNVNEEFRSKIITLYKKIKDPDNDAEAIIKYFQDNKAFFYFINDLVEKLALDEWLSLFDQLKTSTLSISKAKNTSKGKHTLTIGRSGMLNEKKLLAEKAKKLLMDEQTEVVVFGHTHQPDEWRGEEGKLDGGYFNPGSWTRYVELGSLDNLSLDDLRNDLDFPYELNFIRIEKTESGKLKANKHTYEKADGNRFKLSS